MGARGTWKMRNRIPPEGQRLFRIVESYRIMEQLDREVPNDLLLVRG